MAHDARGWIAGTHETLLECWFALQHRLLVENSYCTLGGVVDGTVYLVVTCICMYNYIYSSLERGVRPPLDRQVRLHRQHNTAVLLGDCAQDANHAQPLALGCELHDFLCQNRPRINPAQL
eukprot:scaffold650_cov407-Prasinococcus_capsulatus_cf.AAC.36